MNYTKPNNPDHEDSPEDWLNAALIFGRSVALLLENNQGVVVDLKGDMKCPDPENEKGYIDHNKVIVYLNDNMIRIAKFEQDYKEGTVIWVLNEDDEDLAGT